MKKEISKRSDVRLMSPLVYQEMPVAGVSSASHAKLKEQLINVDALKHKRNYNQESSGKLYRSPSIEKPVRPFDPP
jgi:hypothetical protein